ARRLPAAMAPPGTRPEADASDRERGADRVRAFRDGTPAWATAHHDAARARGARAPAFPAPGSRRDYADLAVRGSVHAGMACYARESVIASALCFRLPSGSRSPGKLCNNHPYLGAEGSTRRRHAQCALRPWSTITAVF